MINDKARPDIVVKYPPDYDGELHIQVDENMYGYRFTMNVAMDSESETPRQALARVAGDIARKVR